MQRLACLLLLMSVACRPNPNYCEGNPGPNNCDLMWDAANEGCTSNQQCSGATPVCDVEDTKTCVQCTATQADACSGMTPVCSADNTCEACTMHAQCASGACLPDGSCAEGSNVAYVDAAGTDNTTCSEAMPCTTITNALMTNRAYVKIHGTIDEQVTLNNKSVTFLADPGAKLTSTTNGVILTASGASTVTIYDLEITGASGATAGIGVSIPTGSTSTVELVRAKVTQSQSVGVSASGGTLIMKRSTITGNGGGGVSISSAQFDITNSVIASNGGNGSFFGGVKLDQIAASGTRRLDFNTITQNQAPMNIDTGVTCGTLLGAATFSNNIIYGNLVAGTGKQVSGGMCSFTYSDIGPDPVAGNGNINADPKFVNANQGDYHLMASSPCKDVADPAATLDVDIDGDARPQGSRRDMGADEQK